MRFKLISHKPTILGLKSTWGRLTLGVIFTIIMLLAFYCVLQTRYQVCIPKMKVECLNWQLGVLDKWDKNVSLGHTYAFYSRHMGLYPDGEKIVKRMMASGFSQVVIDHDENVIIDGRKVAHGLQLASKLGLDREYFMGTQVLAPGTYFGLGDLWTSFDSRYWGVIYEDQLIGRLYIVL